MKTLEEKIKDIRELCQNLDKNIIVTITQKVTIKNSIEEYKNIVRVSADVLYGIFNIDNYEQYNDLIDKLKKLQKEPDLYTFDEIIRTIDNASIYYSHNDDYINWLKEFIKNNIDIYQKLD